MSSTSKLDIAFGPSWRAAAVKSETPTVAGRLVPSVNVAKLSSNAVFYTQPSGADLFPEVGLVKTLLKRLRRA